jgi:hypothetical protein
MAYNWTIVPQNLLDDLPESQGVYAQEAHAGTPLSAIAAKYEVSERTVTRALAKARIRIANAGWSPTFDATRFVDPGQRVRGKSTLTKDDEGNTVWIKTQESLAVQNSQIMQEAITATCSTIKPLPPIKHTAKAHAITDLCSVYTVTDYHLGMYAWEDEAGADWDMKIAKKLLVEKFAEMVQGTPQSEVGIFAQLGDFLHWDGILAVTPASKHVLDADTRFPALVNCAIECIIECIQMLLHKHERVHVIMAEGNHDQASSMWLRGFLPHLFKKTDRITIETSPHPFYCFEWGETMIAWHHGHQRKMADLPGVFASDPKFRAIWGKASITYIHTGHLHHEKVIEKAGAIVEQHPTLAARDAYGARGFDYSRRAAKAITYSKTKGEVSRVQVVP